MLSKLVLTGLLAAASLNGVMGHGKVTSVQGAGGTSGQGFALVAGTCTGPGKTCQVDTTIFKRGGARRAILEMFGRAAGASAGCGKTKAGGTVNCGTELAKAESSGQVAAVASDGTVSMTIHQHNQDGAGPFKMFVNTDGTGQTWTAMTVTQQVPGTVGLSRATDADFPLVGQMPAGTTCTGGADGQTCLVRAQNPIGPFGGVAAVTQADAGAAAAGGPKAATANTAATGSTAATTSTTGAKTGTKANKAGGFLANLGLKKARALSVGGRKLAIRQPEDIVVTDEDTWYEDA